MKKALKLFLIFFISYTILINILGLFFPTDYPHQINDLKYNIIKFLSSVFIALLISVAYYQKKYKKTNKTDSPDLATNSQDD